MQICGRLDKAEVHEGIHDVLDLFLVLLSDDYLFLEHVDEVVLFEWGSLLDLSLLSHGFLLLFVIFLVSPRLFASLRVATLPRSSGGAALLALGVATHT